MSKQTVNPEWFQRIPRGATRNNYAWLISLRNSVNRIVNFGCMSNEPFALLWTLDAEEIIVVEKDLSNLEKEDGPIQNLEFLRKYVPASMDSRTVKFIVADMTSEITELSSDYFDLAYCENVLYFMGDDLLLVQRAIDEMARVVNSDGLVIAVEPKIGTERKTISQDFFGIKKDISIPSSNPININHLFVSAGLIKTEILDAPEGSYCYQKPTSGTS